MKVIYAEDVEPEMQTFGFSLAGGKDIDGNEYPDIYVGAYEAAKAVMFRFPSLPWAIPRTYKEARLIVRTKPVVSVTGSVKVTPNIINLDDKLCEIGGQFFTCGKFHLCAEYTGKNAPRNLGEGPLGARGSGRGSGTWAQTWSW